MHFFRKVAIALEPPLSFPLLFTFFLAKTLFPGSFLFKSSSTVMAGEFS